MRVRFSDVDGNIYNLFPARVVLEYDPCKGKHYITVTDPYFLGGEPEVYTIDHSVYCFLRDNLPGCIGVSKTRWLEQVEYFYPRP